MLIMAVSPFVLIALGWWGRAFIRRPACVASGVASTCMVWLGHAAPSFSVPWGGSVASFPVPVMPFYYPTFTLSIIILTRHKKNSAAHKSG